MENFKGTPAPWNITSQDDMCCEINEGFIDVWSGMDVEYDQMLANAQLIAHAPELLEMVKELHQLLEENQGEAKFYTRGHHKLITDLLTRATTIK